MKFSLFFCGFFLLWHPGNVFVRSADAPAPPSTTPTATDAPIKAGDGTANSTTKTTEAAPAPVTTTSNPSAPPGDPKGSPTSPGSFAPTNSTPPSARTTPSNVTSTGPPAASSSKSPNNTEGVSEITTTGPAISTASTVTSVSPVTTTSSATTAPAVASTTMTPPTTPPPTTTPPTMTPPTPTPPTPTPPTTTPPTMTPPTTTPPTIHVIINETNLLLADNNFFVELSGPVGGSLSGITLVVYNATDNTELKGIKFGAEDKLKTNGLYVLNLNDTGKYLDTALLVLYKPGSSDGERKVMDFIIASMSTGAADSVAPALKEKLGMTDKPIIIVNRTKLVAMNISGDISLIRCDKGGKPDPSALIISHSSMDAMNNCTFPNDPRRGFEFKIVASGCIEWNNSITTKLQDVIINNVNSNCQCGMTSGLFDNGYWSPPQDKCSSNGKKSTTNVFSGKFVSMFASQTSAIREAYTTYVMTWPNITVGAQTFTVTNCSFLCVLPAPHIPSKDKGNISVTVAVVLSCIAVFLIILVAVVIYLRRQRRGVLQFRMTRLAEDDDMEDMEDFVGGPMDDHEPSFNNSHYKDSR